MDVTLPTVATEKATTEKITTVESTSWTTMTPFLTGPISKIDKKNRQQKTANLTFLAI